MVGLLLTESAEGGRTLNPNLRVTGMRGTTAIPARTTAAISLAMAFADVREGPTRNITRHVTKARIPISLRKSRRHRENPDLKDLFG